jgi:hypothetical protein
MLPTFDNLSLYNFKRFSDSLVALIPAVAMVEVVDVFTVVGVEEVVDLTVVVLVVGLEVVEVDVVVDLVAEVDFVAVELDAANYTMLQSQQYCVFKSFLKLNFYLRHR